VGLEQEADEYLVSPLDAEVVAGIKAFCVAARGAGVTLRRAMSYSIRSGATCASGTIALPLPRQRSADPGTSDATGGSGVPKDRARRKTV